MNATKATPFNVRLKELRQAHGYSYRRLADALAKEGVKITHTALRKWELDTEKALPPREKIAALSRVFNVKPSFLLEEIFEAKPSKNNRSQYWQDLDLLTEEQHDILLKLKVLMLERGDYDLGQADGKCD